MTDPPVAWIRETSGLAEPESVKMVRDAVLEIRDSSDLRTDKTTLIEADRWLEQIDRLLAQEPSPPERTHLVQSAQLLARVCRRSHQRRGNGREAKRLALVAERLHQTADFTDLPFNQDLSTLGE